MGKPEMNFGMRDMDDGSVSRILKQVAPVQMRNYVIMELKGSLMKEERREMLARFNRPMFRRVAHVIVGEPTLEFKKRSQEMALKQKQEASDNEFRLKKAQEKQARIFEKRKRELERARKKQEKSRKKAEEEREKKLEADAASAAAEKK